MFPSGSPVGKDLESPITPIWRSQVQALGKLNIKSPCCLPDQGLGTGACACSPNIVEQSSNFPVRKKKNLSDEVED